MYILFDINKAIIILIIISYKNGNEKIIIQYEFA